MLLTRPRTAGRGHRRPQQCAQLARPRPASQEKGRPQDPRQTAAAASSSQAAPRLVSFSPIVCCPRRGRLAAGTVMSVVAAVEISLRGRVGNGLDPLQVLIIVAGGRVPSFTGGPG